MYSDECIMMHFTLLFSVRIQTYIYDCIHYSHPHNVYLQSKGKETTDYNQTMHADSESRA